MRRKRVAQSKEVIKANYDPGKPHLKGAALYIMPFSHGAKPGIRAEW